MPNLQICLLLPRPKIPEKIRASSCTSVIVRLNHTIRSINVTCCACGGGIFDERGVSVGEVRLEGEEEAGRAGMGIRCVGVVGDCVGYWAAGIWEGGCEGEGG
jgi:hypothetical protein